MLLRERRRNHWGVIRSAIGASLLISCAAIAEEPRGILVPRGDGSYERSPLTAREARPMHRGSNQYNLYDDRGRRVGTVRTNPSGRSTVYDRQGRRVR